jgi:type VI protein secretion system component Hcp
MRRGVCRPASTGDDNDQEALYRMAYKVYWKIPSLRPSFPEMDYLLSFSFGPQIRTTGNASYHPPVSDIVVVRKIDKYSPIFAQASASGRHIGDVSLVFTTGTGKSLHTVLKYDFINCFVANYVPHDGRSGTDPTEMITLNFTSVKTEPSK